MNREKLIESFVEVKLNNQDDFLKIKETLARIGIVSKAKKTLWQSCHILHKKGKYYVVHFKELFALDGKVTNFDENDRLRRNKIASLLHDWELCDIVEPEKYYVDPSVKISNLTIIPFKEKSEWILDNKYEIGVKKNG